MIGLTSSAAKGAHARSAGADAVFQYGATWVDEVTAWAGGGVDVVYDAVGSTLDESLRAVRKGGQVVFYGFAGGAPKPVDPRVLMDGSKSLTGGDLWNVLISHQERLKRSQQLFTWIREGAVHAHVSKKFPLAEGAAAHRHLEDRANMGKVLLMP